MEYMASESEMNQQNETEQGQVPEVETPTAPRKINMLCWKIVCLVLAVLVTLGWIGIITVLIFKEEWQLVLIAWLLLYAAAHFCYWYCRRHSSRTLSAQIRQVLMTRLHGTDAARSCETDCPPSYDDLVKSETPPPTYYAVVSETRKLTSLPWFIKRKFLNQSVVTVSEGKSSSAVESAESSPTTSGEEEKAADTDSVCSASSISITMNDDEEPTVQRPSYEVLMRDSAQPVMTPIHQALAKLPSLPPPYSPRPLDTIHEVEQQQHD
ncbi:hypothetical protein FHG87_000535 [Trinorchestia longiramus]|nr:hypothetical protein FHG87_000535 [Trinorchestia longiramus]